MTATARPWFIRPPLILIVTSLLLAVTGLAIGLGGVWLAVLGGSLYYVITGVALLATAVLVWRGRVAALWVYALILLGTLAWALWEVGLDFWALAPRGDVIAPLGLWLLLPFVAGRLAPDGQASEGGQGRARGRPAARHPHPRPGALPRSP
jgi:quinoprotein glucose dehydrogenase